MALEKSKSHIVLDVPHEQQIQSTRFIVLPPAPAVAVDKAGHLCFLFGFVCPLIWIYGIWRATDRRWKNACAVMLLIFTGVLATVLIMQFGVVEPQSGSANEPQEQIPE